MNENILKDSQEVLYKLFYNSIANNRVSNSYILYGDYNAPLKDISLYLAKSLSCNTSTFACNSCPSCKRFDLGKSPDFFFIDGAANTIKKQDIKGLISHFEYSALEDNHIPTYVINMVDNITQEAANALLKFLEEPKNGIVAFLTTHNINAVLKTIVSRSVTVKVNSLNQKEYFKSLCELTYPNKNKISNFHAYILSRITSSSSEANSIIEDENNVYAIEIIESFLLTLQQNKKEAMYLLLSLASHIKENKCYNYLFTTLSILISDVLSNSIFDECGIAEVLKNIPLSKSKLINIKSILEEVVKLRRYNLSNTTIISRIIKEIGE